MDAKGKRFMNAFGKAYVVRYADVGSGDTARCSSRDRKYLDA
jgi:hypothetical protein